MFISNSYIDVYREIGPVSYSEYDGSDSDKQLIYRNAPIQLTPFNPRYGDNGTQTTSLLATTRLNVDLMVGDQLRTKTGRVFEVLTVEPSQGAFYKNSRVYQLAEHSPLGQA